VPQTAPDADQGGGEEVGEAFAGEERAHEPEGMAGIPGEGRKAGVDGCTGGCPGGRPSALSWMPHPGVVCRG
jgi:hypothetical protein